MPGARSLRLLVSAGRHLNFTRAADELGLTPAAVSFQIREIEDQLGLKLFTRTSRSMRLTEAGAIMVDAAQDAIDALNKGVIRAQRAARGLHLLKVTVDPQFATRWLMRRIENFRKRHPTLELRFDVSYDLRDFELDDVDVAIRFGTGGYPGLASHRLFDNVIVPVCSPALLKRGKGLNEPRDLQDHMLAHIEWSEQGITWPNWRMWMSAAGVSEFDDSRAVVFTHSSDAVQAALAGEAVALVDFAMVANELSQGTLIRPFGLSLRPPPEFAYFLVFPRALTEDHRVIAFRTWLEDEVSKMERA